MHRPCLSCLRTPKRYFWHLHHSKREEVLCTHKNMYIKEVKSKKNVPDRIIVAVNDFPKREKVHSRPSLHIIVFFFVLFRPSFITCSTKIIWMHCSVLLSFLLFFFETIKSPWPSSCLCSFWISLTHSGCSHKLLSPLSLVCSIFNSCGFLYVVVFSLLFSSSHFRPFTDSQLSMILRCSIERALCVSRVFHVFLSLPETENIALFIFDDYEYFFIFWGEGNDELLMRGTKNQKYLHSISFDLIVE